MKQRPKAPWYITVYPNTTPTINKGWWTCANCVHVAPINADHSICKYHKSNILLVTEHIKDRTMPANCPLIPDLKRALSTTTSTAAPDNPRYAHWWCPACKCVAIAVGHLLNHATCQDCGAVLELHLASKQPEKAAATPIPEVCTHCAHNIQSCPYPEHRTGQVRFYYTCPNFKKP